MRNVHLVKCFGVVGFYVNGLAQSKFRVLSENMFEV